MVSLKMEPEELRNKARTYLESSNQIDEMLARLSNLQIEMDEVWSGNAKASSDQQFEALRPQVQQFSSLLLDIQEQLITIANKTEELDNEISQSIGY